MLQPFELTILFEEHDFKTKIVTDEYLIAPKILQNRMPGIADSTSVDSNFKWSHPDSNRDHRFRRPTYYPLYYETGLIFLFDFSPEENIYRDAGKIKFFTQFIFEKTLI